MRSVPSRVDLLKRAVSRLVTDHRFFASALFDWSDGDIDFTRIAGVLGSDQASIIKLALCFRPRCEPSHFRDDIARIAVSIGVDAGRLTEFLREADALAAFRRPAEQGLLAAARDFIGRDEDGTGEK
jgi:hypothetical protein